MLPLTRFREWEAQCSARYTCTDDIAHLRRLLEDNASTIFISNPTNLCLEYLAYVDLQETCVPTKRILKSTSDLLSLANSNASHPRDHVLGTWSRIRLSLEMFQVLCHIESIHPAFLEIVMSFGFKTDEEDEYYTPSFCKLVDPQSLSYEIFYSIQYVEKHGRAKPADPWSFRKYAVYQRYDHDNLASSWIIIQPQDIIRQWLDNGACSKLGASPWGPLYAHLRFLKTSSISWRFFLNYLSDELSRIRIKVVCQIDPILSHGSDDVNFLQSQALEIIQAKARRARSAIEATISLIDALDHYSDEFSHVQQKRDHEDREDRGEKEKECLTSSPNHRQLHVELQQLSANLSIHVRKAHDLVKNIASVNILIQRTLDLRNAAALHTSNTALRQISSSSASESRTMLQLAALSRHDARIMKVASIIALMYLPAGFVASIFSTELVSMNPITLDIRRGVVVFLVLLVTLTLGTGGVAVLWIRRDGAGKGAKVVNP